jgi:LysM repeat protein
MKRLPILLGLTCILALNTFAQSKKRISFEDYIDTYKTLAIGEMKRSGIPASITLAQGSLESENGNSILTVEGNNHFGIKCHKWTGQGIYKDDDSRNECFRKYKSAWESFRDHSDFLQSGQRYNFLFEYKPTDYKSWAKGLKKAGYATNPHYPEQLIKIIEDNKLYLFDQGVETADFLRIQKIAKAHGSTNDEFTININVNRHPVYQRNSTDYIVVRNGDTFEKLANELEMFTWQFTRYNELTKDSVLHEGQILYLKPKCRKAEQGKEFHTVLAGETIYSISQLYGVKTKHIRRLNRLEKDAIVKEGDILNLRTKKNKT